MANFQTVPHPIISRGMDTRSALRNIQAGFASDIRNMNTSSAGFVTKRKGFQGEAGNLPLRVTEVFEDGAGGYELEVDASVALKNAVSAPIIVKGKLWTYTTATSGSRTASLTTGGALTITNKEPSESFTKGDQFKIQDSNGVWTLVTILSAGLDTDYSGIAVTDGLMAIKEDLCIYRESFDNNTYRAITSGTAVQFQNASGALDQLVGIALQGSGTSYELIETSTTQISADDFTHLLEFIGSGITAANYRVADSATTTSYKATTTFGTGTFTITQATHGLPNKNIISQFYLVDHTIDEEGVISGSSGTNTLIEPESMIIKPNGDIDLVFNDASGEILTTDLIQVVLEDVPTDNTAITGLSGTDEEFLFTMPIESEFAFVNAYLLTASGQEQVKVESVVVDGDEVTLTIDLPAGAGSEDLKIVTLEGETSNSTITITGDGVPDSTPELCIYGIQPEDIGFKNNAGVINSLEEYTSIAQSWIVAGMGGNLFAEGSTCLMPSKAVNIRASSNYTYSGPVLGTTQLSGTATLAGDTTIVGSDTAFTTELTVGDNVIIGGETREIATITDDTNATVTATFTVSDSSLKIFLEVARNSYIQYIEPLFDDEPITQIVPDSDSGEMTVSFTNAYIDLSDANITDQYLKIENAGNSKYNGVFAIQSVDNGVAKTATLSNTALDATDKTETDTAAVSAIDTCFIEVESGHNLAVEDIITSNQFPEYDPVVRYQEATKILIGNVTGVRQIYPGVILGAKRTTDVIPVDETSATFVKGDMCTLTGFDRQFRVLDLEIASPLVNVTIDESIEVEDNVSFPNYLAVPFRWEAIELPDLNVPTVKHFAAEYDLQDRLQTARINDSIFYTDYTGAVMKYDGYSLYRAGLPNFKPKTHSWADLTDEKIVVTAYTIQSTGAISGGSVELQFEESTFPTLPENNEIYIVGSAQKHTEKAVTVLDYDSTNFKITVSTDDVVESLSGGALTGTATASASTTITGTGTLFTSELSVGDSLTFAGDTTTYYVVSITNDTSMEIDTAVTVSGVAMTQTVGEVSIPQYANYYYKLQAYDRNNNIIASATTADTTNTVKLLKSGKVVHQFTNLPKFDSYDYERIDVEIYRTRWAESPLPVFFRISTIPLELEVGQSPKVFTYEDLQGNSLFSASSAEGDDLVSNSISVVERPINYNQPQKCKYLTSVSNRLVQGNIKGYDKLELRFDTDATSIDNTSVSIDGTVYNFGTTQSPLVDEYEYTASTGELKLYFASAHSLSADQWIHLISERTSNNYQSKDLAGIVGWWKIKSVPATDELLIDAPEFADADISLTAIVESLYAYTAGASEVPVKVLEAGPTLLDYPYNNVKRELVVDDPITAAYEGMIELAKAVNRVQLDLSEPTVYAEANSPLPARVIKITAAKPDKTFEVVVTTSDDIRLFANNLLVQSGDTIDSVGYVFPSRVLVSPINFPETFDNPLASSAIYSSSIVDVNADDGQEITGFSSFLADSNSSDSQLQSTLIVFKSSSVYALDVNTRVLSKLESHGQGCTIASSIAPTMDGIMFANDSGIYVVTKQLDVQYIGKPMEGYWSTVNVGSGLVGFTDSFDRTYRLAVPTGDDTRNSEVVNYDYVTERDEFGAWSLWDGISPAEWVQTETDTYYGDYSCRVFKQRTAGEASDYRDDNQAITASFTYSPRSFGDGSSEVIMKGIVSHIEEGSGIDVYESTEFSKSFTRLDSISIDGTRNSYAIESSPNAHSVLFYQIKYEHSTADEGFKLTGIDFKVAQTNDRKITQAGET